MLDKIFYFHGWSVDIWIERNRESIFDVCLDIRKDELYFMLELWTFNIIIGWNHKPEVIRQNNNLI